MEGYLEKLKEQLTEEDYREILNIALQDIEFNRVGFNKNTTYEEFIEILGIAKDVYMNVKGGKISGKCKMD